MIVQWIQNEDIFKSQAQTLVCPVNTVGIMGNGLAKYFALKVKNLLLQYQHACRTKQLVVGKPWLYKGYKRNVLCFATKEDWRNPSKLEWLEQGLKYVADNYEAMGITSLAIPKIGCGKGLLEWTEVKPLIIKYLDPISLPVYVYEV